jgi:hypothetical protein
MKRILPFLVLLGLAHPAHAEFSMVSNEAETPSQPEPSPAPRPDPSKAHATVKLTKSRTHSNPRPSPAMISSTTTPLASGFGAQVPLAFAIRQMAPDGYEIVFAPPADPNSPVDWRGGRPWTQALADAVQPLGLAVSVHDKTVTISPAQTR